MNEKPPIRVFLTDDHQIILDGLKSLLGGADDIIVCGEANSGQEMLDRMIVDQTEVLIIDVDMPVMGGREAVSRLKEKAPDIAIIALSMHQESGVVQAMKRAGVSAYLLKNASREELIDAIRKVAAGERVKDNDQVTAPRRLVENENAPVLSAKLTRRELEILKLISEGFSNTEIGDQLSISHRTVDTHRTNLMKKIGAKNIAGLIRFAFKQGLLE